MLKNCKLPDLHELKKNMELVLLSLLFILFLSYFFYHTFWPAIFLIPVGYVFYRIEAGKKAEREKLKLTVEFKEMLCSISANLQAGYAIENAILEAKKDLILLYGENTQIIRICDDIIKGLHNQIPVEVLFYRFGEKTQIQEVIDFASVFAIGKRTGGNIVNIIQSTSNVISNKIEVKNEIHTMIAAKQMEANIMNVVPFAIVYYISLTSPHFFDSMYEDAVGTMIMTVCLILYLVAYFLMQKICKIEL